MKTRAPSLFLAVTMAGGMTPAFAIPFNGIEFPQGAASFADSVANFSPGAGPGSAFLDAGQALGPPDVTTSTGTTCFFTPTPDNCKFTSLGNGGSLTVRFLDNVLTGSRTSGSGADGINDLWVIEVGVSESSNVEISTDGSTWIDVGDIVGGGGSSIDTFEYGFDIDALGFDYTDQFTWVRITDVLNDANTSPEGADIDAIGAIQTVVPVPAGAWLLPAGLVLGRWVRRRAAG